MNSSRAARTTEFVAGRIFGLETEYAAHVVSLTGEKLNSESLVRKLWAPLGTELNVFLSNGARLYLDGSNPEYCTAEATSLQNLISQDRAGELILNELSLRLEEVARAQGIPAEVFLFKNNTDYSGRTYGCHENYLTHRDLPLATIAAALSPFLLTRQLIAGAGHIVRDGDNAAYAFSARARHIRHPLGVGTTSARSAITDRAELVLRDPRYYRLHLIIGDSNMSEPTTVLKVGATDLVLRMIEAGYRFGDVQISDVSEDYMRSIRQTSLDLTGQGLVTLANGRQIPAIEIQRRYLAQAEEFVTERGLEHRYAYVLDLWRRTLEALETGDRSGIDREIDWAIKLGRLELQQERHGVDLSHARCASVDLRYHDIRPGRGVHARLAERGAVDRAATLEDALGSVWRAPADTRAALRAQFLDLADVTSLAVDWDRLTVREFVTGRASAHPPRPTLPPPSMHLAGAAVSHVDAIREVRPALVLPRAVRTGREPLPRQGASVDVVDPFATSSAKVDALMQLCESPLPAPTPAPLPPRRSATQHRPVR